MAVAENATTMPVITSACGTGSAPKPGRRAPAGNDAEQQEHTAAENVEGKDLAQRLRIGDQAEKPEPDQRRTDNGRTASLLFIAAASVLAGPPPAEPSVTPIESVSAASAMMISGLA